MRSGLEKNNVKAFLRGGICGHHSGSGSAVNQQIRGLDAICALKWRREQRSGEKKQGRNIAPIHAGAFLPHAGSRTSGQRETATGPPQVASHSSACV
jgi:hypothetical protein